MNILYKSDSIHKQFKRYSNIIISINRLVINFLIIASLFFVFGNQAFAQCTLSVLGEGSADDGSAMGQSFTANCNGALSQVKLISSGAHTNTTITIYQGDGLGGAILGTITGVTTHNASGFSDFSIIDLSSANVHVTSGNVYTFYLTNTGGWGLYDTGSNNHAGGMAYYEGSPVSALDFNFVLDIVSTNAAPTVTAPSAPSVSEDATNVVLSDDIQVADTDGNNQTVTFAITGGTLTIGTTGITFGGSGNGTASFTAAGTLAAINTALDAATFTPTPNLSGTNAGTISFTTNDGTVSSSAASVTFNITAINDDPSISGLPTDITVSEDIASNVDLSAATFADVDAGANSIVLTITTSAGILTASSGGSVTIGGSGTGTLSLTGTAANIDAYLNTASNIKYTGASNVNGNDAATLALTANDGGYTGTGGGTDVSLGTVNVDITAINDDPSISGLPTDITVSEDIASNVDLSAATLTDVDAGSSSIVLTVAASAGTLTASSGGSVTIGGSGTGTLSLTGSVANIDAYLNASTNIKYTSASNINGNDAATLTITANDGGYTGTGGGTDVSLGTVNVDITAINDDPSISGLPTDITVTEDVASNVDLSASTLSDVDAGANSIVLTITASAGTLTASSGGSVTIGGSVTGTLSLTGSVANIDAYLNTASNIKYTGASNVNGNYAATLTLTANDGGYTGTGGGTDVSLGTVNVDITAVNDAPTLTSFAGVVETTNQNTEVEITLAELEAQGNEADVDGTVSAFIVKVVSTGSLKIGANSGGATAFNATTNKTIDAGNNAYWTPSSNAYGSLNAFTTTVVDNSDTESTGAVQATVTVNDVTNPEVSGITISGTPAVTATSITYIVAFSESVVNVSTDDFSLTKTGTVDATIASVSASSGSSINVVVNSITGTGSLRLDLNASTNIADASANTPPAIYTSAAVHNVDIDNPTLSSSVPTDNATGVSASANITLTFSENISFGTGNIQIIDLDNNSSTITIDVTSPGIQASISSNVLTLNPSSDLEENTNYAVQIAATAIDDANGNSYVGIADNTTLNFTVADITAPLLVSSTPSNDATNATLGSNIVLTFDDNMVAGTGNITIKKTSDNSTFEQIPIGDSKITIATNLVTINPAATFARGVGYYVEIDATALNDDASNSFAGISGSSILNFTTVDVVINEVVTDPQQDWDSNNFASAPGGTPGSNDEWVELYINSTGIDLTGWTIELIDGSDVIGDLTNTGAFDVSNYVGSGSFANTIAGDYLVLGNPDGAGLFNNTITINLKDPSGVIVDAVVLGGGAGQAPSGNATDIYNESVQRYTNGLDTDVDSDDFSKGIATIGAANTGPSVNLSVSSATIAEAAEVSTITATLSAASSQATTVTIAVNGSSTASAGDYSLSSTSIVISAGSITGTATITAIQDVIDENNETVIIDVTVVTNGIEAGTQQQTVTITDDDEAPTVAFNSTSSNGAESLSSADLQVDLSAASSFNITVDYTVTGTATGSGTDYTLANGTLVFAAGDVNKNITIAGIVNDLLDENNETVIVTLSNPSNATLGTNTVHTYTINDDDVTPTIAFNLTSSNGDETVSSANLQVDLSAASGRDVTVDYTVTGTATGSGSDYTLANGTLTITAGSANDNITIVNIVNDLLDENNETVILTLSNPTNATLGSNTVHTYTINDDDATPTIAFNSTSSNGDESVSSVNLQVDLSAASGRIVSVNYTVTGTATGSGTDYTLANGMLTIAAGDATDNITIAGIVNDLLDENNETVIVTLSNPSNATLGSNTVHTYTITDDDATPTVAFNAVSSNESESVSSANLQVDLSAASGLTVTVDYAVTGTASGSGTDYTLANGTLTIPAGTANNNITIAGIVDDLLDENNETVIVTLSNPTNATLGTNTIHTYTINDDDVPPTIAFNLASSNGAESVISKALQVDLSAASSFDITVDYVVTGTATGSGTDYTLVNGTLTILAGSTTNNITIASIVNDLLDENNETVIVTLSNPSNATLGTNTVHTYTINDDDATPTVAFNLTSSNGAESVSSVDLQVNLSAASSFNVTVDYTVSGTATGSGTDYTLADGTLTITAGSATNNITIASIVNDLFDENNETVIVTLSNPTNASLGANTGHTYTINDDDAVPTVSFNSTSSNGDEFLSSANLQLDLSSVSGLAVAVDYTVTGTATGSGTDYTLADGTLTIPAGTSNNNITIAGIVNDLLDENNETVIVTLSNPSNATLGTNTVHTYTIIDDDFAGVTIVESDGNTSVSEEGTTDSFTVVLDAQPISDVVLNISSSDIDEATVNPSSLTFTSTDWNTPQAVVVTGIDDELPDSQQTSIITISVDDESSDDAFDSVADKTVSVVTLDNDIPGVTVVETNGTTSVSESGSTDEFTVVLDAAPNADVVLNIGVDESEQAIVDKSTLTFTPANWSTSQTVIVSSVDDLLVDGDISSRINICIDDNNSCVTYINVDDKVIDLTVFDNDAYPVITTLAASSIAATSVILNGIVNANNQSTTITFEYGTTTSYGTTVTADESPVTGMSNTPVSKGIIGLLPNTTYHYRLVGVNGTGTINGDDAVFTTLGLAPTVEAILANDVTATSAMLNGTVNSNNQSTNVSFEYGITTDYGTTVFADENPITGTINTSVSKALNDLLPNTTYHYRVVAVNATGTSYSDDITLTTLDLSAPTAITDEASSITPISVVLNGTVNSHSQSTTVTFEYGTTTDYGNSVTVDQSPLTGSSNSAVTKMINGLLPNTSYHYRVVAVNGTGLTNGDDVLFTTIKYSQEITFESLDSKTTNDEDFKLEATSSLDLEISYASSNTQVATVTVDMVSIVGVGTTLITASQEGNDTVYAATPVDKYLIVVMTTDIHQSDINIKLYPNPAKLIICLSSGESELLSNAEISIVNAIGVVVYKDYYNEDNKVIDVSNFGAGLYILKVKSSHGMLTRKIVVEK